MTPPAFDSEFCEQLDQLLAWRRDVRRFRTDPVPADLAAELLASANQSPSVGNSQPWRWVAVESPSCRAAVVKSFEQANDDAANDYADETRQHYLSLKLAGLREAPLQYAVFCDDDTKQGKGLGRQTMPEMLRYSAVLSVHTYWLAARARGVGVGWVSILDPDDVVESLNVPSSWQLVAYLCVGWPQVETLEPELQQANWQDRKPMKLLKR